MREAKSGQEPREEPGLRCYLQTIGKHQPLTGAEEAELLREIRRGDREPLDDLINAHLSSVVSIAREFLDQGLSLLDLIAEGTLGLIAAARRFDVTRFSSFAPYAESHVRHAIEKALGESH